MATTPRLGLRYPVGTDSANIAAYFANLASDLDPAIRYRGSNAPFPTTNLLYGDYVYHPTYDCFMVYKGSTTFWRQMNVVEVTSSTRASYVAALNSAGLSMHNGFEVFESDTDRIYKVTDSSNGTLQYVGGGVPQLIGITRGGGWNGTGTTYYNFAGYVDGSGVAHLQGSLVNAAAFSGPGVIASGISTLLRPDRIVAAAVANSAGLSANLQCTADGILTVFPNGTAPAGSTWSFDGISWLTKAAY